MLYHFPAQQEVHINNVGSHSTYTVYYTVYAYVYISTKKEIKKNYYSLARICYMFLRKSIKKKNYQDYLFCYSVIYVIYLKYIYFQRLTQLLSFSQISVRFPVPSVSVNYILKLLQDFPRAQIHQDTGSDWVNIHM